MAQLPSSFWMLLDVGVALTTAHFSIHGNPLTFERFGTQGAWVISGIAATAIILAGIALNLYSGSVLRTWSHCISSTVASSAFATVGFVAAGYFLYYAVPGRLIALAFFGCSFVGVFLLRVPFLVLRKFLQTRIFLIGTQQEYEALKIQLQGPHSYELVEFWNVKEFAIGPQTSVKLEQVCVEQQVDDIVLSSEKNQVAQWFDLVLAGVRHGCRLRVLPDLIEDEAKEVPVDLVDSAWLLGGNLDVKNHLSETMKRLTDLFVGTIGFVLCLPIFMLLGLLIKLTTHGPVFYTQVRVGRFGRTFKIIKFRTMAVDAEKEGAQWATVGDPRVTWYGGLLRKSRLDETPQFLNVVFGHMSFVGPRPERPEFVAELDEKIPYYGCRHLVRPGLTGWAQISYRYGASVEDAKRKLQFDLYYVRHQSLTFDLYIILRTFLAIAKGAR